jgi:hypothetical protein
LPEAVTLEIVREFVPFVRVKVSELEEPIPTEPKFWLVGLRLTEVLVATPVPVSAAVCGLFDALSVTVNVPFSVPDEVGLKLTVIVHDPFAASVCGQFDVWE